MPRGAAQVLAAGGREEVAAQRVDVDRELPGGLARVEQVGHARVAGRPRPPPRPGSPARPGSGSTTSRPAARGRRASSRERVDRQLARLVVGHHLDVRTGARAPAAAARSRCSRTPRCDVRTRSPGANDARQRVRTPCPTRASRSRRARSRRADAPTSAATESYTAVDALGDERRRPRTRRRAPRARGARSRCRAPRAVGSAAPALLRCDDVAAPGRVGPDAGDVDHRLRSARSAASA